MALSISLLDAIKKRESVDSIQNQLLNYTLQDLVNGLPSDQSKNVFWINLYNAGYQILASKEKTPEDIFTIPAIQFGDFALSLDDIEHGILRQYRWKYSLGYLPQWYPSKIVLQLAVDRIDYRIHFALNCGARSCPGIRIYQYGRVSDQLNDATKLFILSNTIVNTESQTLQVSRIFKWFSADFEGKPGIRKIIGDHLNLDLSEYKITYSEYDWTPQLMNFE